MIKEEGFELILFQVWFRSHKKLLFKSGVALSFILVITGKSWASALGALRWISVWDFGSWMVRVSYEES